ncbi:hypothetical protein [Microbacterium tumbae]
MTARAHSFEVRAGIPAPVLRLLLVAVGGGAGFLLNPYPLWQWIGLLAAVVGAAFPQTLAAWGSAAGIVLGILLAEPAPLRTAGALLAVHLVHVLGCLCLTMPLSSRISLAALRPTLARVLLVEVIAQPIALLGVLLPVLGTSGFAWLAPAGALIVVALAVLVLRVQRGEGSDGGAALRR